MGLSTLSPRKILEFGYWLKISSVDRSSLGEKSVCPPYCESPLKFKIASLFLMGNLETNENSGLENLPRLCQSRRNSVPSFCNYNNDYIFEENKPVYPTFFNLHRTRQLSIRVYPLYNKTWYTERRKTTRRDRKNMVYSHWSLHCYRYHRAGCQHHGAFIAPLQISNGAFIAPLLTKKTTFQL
jgi:hypothetical protein